MTVDPILLCGNGCGHDHNSPTGPSGCCTEHGPYLYFCCECHGRWREANPERVAAIAKLVRKSFRPERGAAMAASEVTEEGTDD